MPILTIFLARFLILIPFSICTLYLIIKKDYRYIVRIFFSGVVVNILSEIFKFIIPTQRPFVQNGLPAPIWVLSNGSFFSGHAASLFALGVLMWRKNRTLSVISFVFGFLVGYLRVLIGAHYPVDIVGGIFFGLLTGYAFAKITTRSSASDN